MFHCVSSPGIKHFLLRYPNQSRLNFLCEEVNVVVRNKKYFSKLQEVNFLRF